MRALDGDIDPSAGPGQGDGIPLFKPRNPDLVIELKNMVGMRVVGFGGRDNPVIDVAGEALPRILTQHVPFTNYLAGGADLYHHIESGDCDQQGSFARGVHMVKIVEARQRNVVQELEAGKLINQNLGRGTQ